MLELVDWLQQHIPSEDSSSAKAGLVHGDFRIDNLVFHPIEVCNMILCFCQSNSLWSKLFLSNLVLI